MEDNKDVQVTGEAKVEETTQKTYTHDEIDNSFKAGYKKAKIEFEKSEDYKNYQEWKKNNQNNSEKYNELQSNYNKIDTENRYLKSLIKVNNSDVKKEFSKFVTSEVMNMANDTIDFDTALESYKKENPQYFGETVVKKVQSSPNLNGGQQPTSTNEIMNNILRGATSNN